MSLAIPLYKKARPPPFCTRDRESESMEVLENLLRYREPESMSRSCSTRCICLIETVENMRKMALRYTDTRVSDLERLPRYDNLYISIWRCEFLCVSDDITHSCEKELWKDRKYEFLFFYDLYTRIIVSERAREEDFDIFFFWIFDIIAGEKEKRIDDR